MNKNDPLGMSESKSSGASKSAKVRKPIIIKQSELSAQELRDFADLFEPLDNSRKIAEIFESGQSLLCDVYEGADGSTGLTFLTVSSHDNGSSSPVIKLEQNTVLLQKSGAMAEVRSPSIIFQDYQSAEVSLERPGKAAYSLAVEGFHLGGNKIQVMVEFRGIPIMDRE
ncbi:MAG: hypothetical protein QM496_17360 [Verrucomicrobiota bacterium]